MSYLGALESELAARDASGLLRTIPHIERRGPGWIELEGQRFVDLSSNDYLGLSMEPEVIEAARAALSRFGAGAGASRLITGNSALHEELEHAIAEFKGAESALLFPSGYAAGSGLLAALPREGDIIFVDRLAHACLVEGARNSAAQFRVFPHNDVARLEQLLHGARAANARWIVVDGLYSMDGDIAPLRELLALAARFDATLIVDDAHGTGTLGPNGEGTAAHCGITPSDFRDRLIVIATFSKALGAQGGAVLGPRALREWCVNSVRTQIYSTGLSPAAASAALASIRFLRVHPERVARLHALSNELRRQLSGHSVPILEGESAIIPVMCGDVEDALALAASMREAGILGAAIRPPTVPAGSCRVRLSVSAAHRDEELSRAAVVCAEYFERRCSHTEPHTCS